MVDPTQGSLIARKLGEAPIGLFGAQSYFDRRGRVTSLEDLMVHDMIGFDRGDGIIKLYAAHGLTVTREDFALRWDEAMAY